MMKKSIIIAMAAASLLTACTNNKANTSNDTVEKQPSLQKEEMQANNQPKEANSNDEKWSTLPEYDAIMQHIDKKDYSFKAVTDNEGKRILLLIDQEGHEQYKSIFIKATSRLKIIKLGEEGQIFNEVLSLK